MVWENISKIEMSQCSNLPALPSQEEATTVVTTKISGVEKPTAGDTTTELAIETSLERNGDKQEEEDFEEVLSPPIIIPGPAEIEVQVWSRP